MFKVLDLFCGSGGAAEGMHQALEKAGIKHSIRGHDINGDALDDYPFDGRCSDVMKLWPGYLARFNFIWASPPCQAYSIGTAVFRKNEGRKYPELIEATRKLLIESKRPYCIENVPNAPIRADLFLCGAMFGLGVIRHRHFEISGFQVPALLHPHHYGQKVIGKKFISVAGNGGDSGYGNTSLKRWREVMGTPWIKKRKHIAEAVPPAYSEYIMHEYLVSKGIV